MKPKPLKRQEVLSGSSARYEVCPIGLGFNSVGSRHTKGHVNVTGSAIFSLAYKGNDSILVLRSAAFAWIFPGPKTLFTERKLMEVSSEDLHL